MKQKRYPVFQLTICRTNLMSLLTFMTSGPIVKNGFTLKMADLSLIFIKVHSSLAMVNAPVPLFLF